MKKLYSLSFPLIALGIAGFTLQSCVNDNYDFEQITQVNTDLNIGGSQFALPIGSLSPITLGQFLKPSDMLQINNGKYEIRYNGQNVVSIPTIAPISINATLPTIPSVVANFGVSLSKLKLSAVKIEGQKEFNIPSLPPSTPFAVPIDISGTTPIKIQLIDQKIKQINWISFGSTSLGDLFEFNIDPNYAGTVSDASLAIKSFSITFPAGFEISTMPADPYQGRVVSVAGKPVYNVRNSVLQAGKPFSLYIKKANFLANPLGGLDYNEAVDYSMEFELSGKTTGVQAAASINYSADKSFTIKDGQVKINDIQQTMPATEAVITVSERIDSPEIVSVSDITFANNVALTLKVNIQGLPDGVKNIKLNNYTVKFPDFMVFADPQINDTKTLVLNDELSVEKGISKVVMVSGCHFKTNPMQNGTLFIQGKLILSGGYVVPASTVLTSELNDVQISPSGSIAPMSVATVTCVVDKKVQINPMDIEINIGDDDLELLKNSKIDLYNLVLSMSVVNPTGLGMGIGLKLTPKDDKGNVIQAGIVEQGIDKTNGINILPNATSNVWFSNLVLGKPEGYLFVENKSLPNLLKVLPSSLTVDMTASTEAQQAVINMQNQPDKLTLNYSLLAPLSLGAGFELVYTLTAEDVKSQLADYLGYVNSLEIMASIQNDVPLEFMLSAVAKDAAGVPIGVVISTSGGVNDKGVVASGTKQGTAVGSDIVLSIKETTKGELAKMDKIDLRFSGNANQTVVGASLKENQSLKVKLAAKVPGGIVIKK